METVMYYFDRILTFALLAFIFIAPPVFVYFTVELIRLKKRFLSAEVVVVKLAREFVDKTLLKIRFKRIDKNAKALIFRHLGDSGVDLASIDEVTIAPGETWKIRTGIVVELPPFFEIQVRPRYSLTAKGIVAGLGTIDCGYRGEIIVVLTNNSAEPFEVKVGDRIAQAVVSPIPVIDFVEADNIKTDTDRGTDGFGSTGVK